MILINNDNNKHKIISSSNYEKKTFFYKIVDSKNTRKFDLQSFTSLFDKCKNGFFVYSLYV